MFGLIGSIIGAGASIFGASQANKSAAKLAQANNAFQERMSSTAVQRRTADMRAAGVNPILAAGAAATAPAGNVAPVINTMEGAASSARSAATEYAQRKNLNTQNSLLQAQIGKIQAESTITQLGIPGARLQSRIPDEINKLIDAGKTPDLTSILGGLIPGIGGKLLGNFRSTWGRSARKRPTSVNIGKKNKPTTKNYPKGYYKTQKAANLAGKARAARRAYNKSLKSGKYYDYPKSNTF